MKDALAKVREFHRVFDCARRDTPGFLDHETQQLRLNLISEEFSELHVAVYQEDMEAIADALADLAYVVIGTAVAYGIPLDRVFDEVHRANMEKAEVCRFCRGEGGVEAYPVPVPMTCPFCHGAGYLVRRRPDGKILKPEGWQPPNIHGALYPSTQPLCNCALGPDRPIPTPGCPLCGGSGFLLRALSPRPSNE